MPQILGDDLLARDADGHLRQRIATVFPRHDVIVSMPGIHATQRVAYADVVNEQRAAKGLPALTEDEEEELWLTAVDLIINDNAILIRPDPSQMDQAFEADELLQELYSKKQIKFLHVMNPRVREAIERRGECWRISSLPRCPEEMAAMIGSSRIGIGGRDMYYYNSVTGTRLLTLQEFSDLSCLDEPEFRRHLVEIQQYTARENRMRNPEIALFMANAAPILSVLRAYDFAAVDSATLHSVYRSVEHLFRGTVPAEFQRDEVDNPRWRSAMYAALIGPTDDAVSEEALLGLSAEFFMQVEWVPGGRIEDGELIVDPVFEEEDGQTSCTLGRAVCDLRARALIFNIMRDYGDIEHVNIGRVAASLSHRQAYAGHRKVYLAEIRQSGSSEPLLRIIRMQKRGVWEHLDQGKDLLAAIIDSEEYTEQILDRRLACRQLGMNLPAHLTARKLCERYQGCNERYRDTMIWSTYFERDYVPGLATDKTPAGKLADDKYAFALARVLGRAAAPNLIVGRGDPVGNVIFDQGDELVIEDVRGLPANIVVTDHTGTFMDCERDLEQLATAYAAPVNRRSPHLSDARAFGEVFLQAFAERFQQMQQDYRRRKRAFNTLFKYQRRGQTGCLADRWECVLRRLETADCRQLVEIIREGFSREDIVR